MATKKQFTFGALILVILTASMYVLFSGMDLRIDVNTDNTVFKSNSTGNWEVTSTETMWFTNANTRIYAIDRLVYTENTSIGFDIIRNVTWKYGIKSEHHYVFKADVKSKESFPIDEYILIYNATDKILQYEIRDFNYNDYTKDISSPFSYGRNMKVSWDTNAYFHKVYNQISGDKILLKWKVNSDVYRVDVRMFDPITNLTSQVAYYKFDTLVNGKFINSVSSNNNGTLVGATMSSNGKINNASNYVYASNQYVSLDDAGDVFDFGAGDWTINWWENRTSAVVDSGIPVFARDDNIYSRLIIGYISSGSNYFLSDNGGNNWACANAFNMGTYDLNKWNMFTLEVSNGRLLSYKNGILTNNASWSCNLGDINAAALIGRAQGGITNLRFDGFIDEFGVWKGRGLTGSEIKELYNNTKAQQYPYVNISELQSYNVLHYRADEGTGNLNDTLNRGSSLTLSGTITNATGKINSARNITAINAKFTGDNTPFLVNNGDFSVNMWINRNDITDNSYIFDTGYSAVGGAGHEQGIMWQINTALCGDAQKVGFGVHIYAEDLSSYLCSASSLSVGNWTMITHTRQYIGGVYNYSVYINGIFDASKTTANARPLLDYSGTGFKIGDPFSSNGAKFTFDEFGFWTKKLNQSEITTLYNNNLGITFPFESQQSSSGITINSINITAQYVQYNTTIDYIYWNANNLTCNVNVTGSDNLTYTWYRNSAIIKTVNNTVVTSDLINNSYYSLNDNITCQITAFNGTNSVISTKNITMVEGYLNSVNINQNSPYDNLTCNYNLFHNSSSIVGIKWYENKTQISSKTEVLSYSMIFDYTKENESSNPFILLNISINNFNNYIGKNLTLELALGSGDIQTFNFIGEEKYDKFIFLSTYNSVVPQWNTNVFYRNITLDTLITYSQGSSAGTGTLDCIATNSCVSFINDSSYTTSAYYSFGDIIPGNNFWVETTSAEYSSSIRDFRIYETISAPDNSSELSSYFTSKFSNYSCEVTYLNLSINSSEVKIKELSTLNVNYNGIRSSIINYEHGSTMRVSANITDLNGDLISEGNLCLNISNLVEYNTINCSIGGTLSYNLSLKTIEDKFSNGESSVNLYFTEENRVNFTSYSGNDEVNFKNWIINGTTYSRSENAYVGSMNDAYIIFKNSSVNSNFTVYYNIDPTSFSCTAYINYSVSFMNISSEIYIPYYNNYTTNPGPWGVPLTGYFGFIFPNNFSSDYINSSTKKIYSHFVVNAYDCQPAGGVAGDSIIFEQASVSKRYYDYITVDIGKGEDINTVLVNMTGYANPTLPNNIKVYAEDTYVKTISDNLVSGIYTLNYFNTTLNSTNVTFHSNPISDSATTKYVGVYLSKSANITNATITLKSIIGKGYRDEVTSYSVSSGSCYSNSVYGGSVDMNWNTYTSLTGPCSNPNAYTTIIENTTLANLTYYDSYNFTFKYYISDNGLNNYTVYALNQTSGNYQQIYYDNLSTNGIKISTYDITAFMNGKNIITKRVFTTYSSDVTIIDYEGRIDYNVYPHNVYFKIGDNSIFTNLNKFNTTNTTNNFKTQINSYLAVCTADISGYCTIPLKFTSDDGVVELSNLSITYNANSNPVNITSSALQTSLDNNEGTIILGVESNTGSIIEFSDLKAYYNGYKNFTSSIYYEGSTDYAYTYNNTNINIHYSKWNYSLPRGTTEILFYPSTSTSKNVIPQGQTSLIPIINISYNNYAKPAIMSVYINNPYPNNLTTYLGEFGTSTYCAQNETNSTSSACSVTINNNKNFESHLYYAQDTTPLYDNNVSTTIFAVSGVCSYAKVNFTYVLPPLASLNNNKWGAYFYDSRNNPTETNYTIPAACINENRTLKISFQNTFYFGLCGQPDDQNILANASCSDGTTTYNLFDLYTSSVDHLYEERMYWNIDKAIIANNTWTNLTSSKSPGDIGKIWMWLDLNFTKTSRLVQPDYYFRACCVDCVCDENATNSILP